MTLRRRSRRNIFLAIVLSVIVAIPLTVYYEISTRPVPIDVTNGYTTALFRGNFTTTSDFYPVKLNNTSSVACISDTGHQNSSLSISLRGFGFHNPYEGGYNWIFFFLNAHGNLTWNLHPKSLVLTESISTNYTPNVNLATLGLGYLDHTVFCQSDLIPINVSNHVVGNEQFTNAGTYSDYFSIFNDTKISNSSMFHLGITCIFHDGAPFLGQFCFFPGVYNLTYYITIGISLTGLAQPVSAQVEVILQNG